MTEDRSTVSETSGQFSPLNNDPTRVAVPSIRGYVYQVTHTALAWAKLKKGETIYLEQAEDFDRLGLVNEAVQVKDYRRSITLRTPAVQDLIRNAWLNRERNPQRNVLTRLLTTASPAMEQGSPFPKPGIDYWRDTAGMDAGDDVLTRAAALGRFMLDYPELPEKMAHVLRSGDAREILEKVITPVSFDVGLVATEGIEQTLRAQLALVATEDGFRLTNIENALNATLKSVWDTVRRESDRVLNLGTLTDVLMATTRTIPPKDASYTGQESVEAAAAFFGPTHYAGQPQYAVVSVLREPPPVAAIHLDRLELIEAARSAVHRANIVIINGPRYVGKSTLAGDVARALGGNWAWVDASTDSASTIRQAVTELRIPNRAQRGVVIDGVPHNDEMAAAELSHLFEVCRSDGIAAVVVPNGEFMALIKQQFGLAPGMEILVGPFNNAEIAKLLLARGCPHERLQAWTRALELTTAGDPVLVSGRVASIERSGFLEPEINDFFGTRTELQELRRNIRLIAAKDLEGPQLEILNRLSISSDAYSRPVALRIAGEDPAIAAPGNVLDGMVGIWIREIVRQRYRVIDLALDFGKETYGEQWASRMHRVAGRAILDQPRITTIEASNALSHAFAAEDEETALRILHQIIGLGGEMLASFAKSANWLSLCYTRNARRPDFIPGDQWWVLRAAQMRVAARSKSAIPQAVIEAFDAENPTGTDKEAVRLVRLVVLSEMLIRSGMAGLSFTQIARYGIEWADLAQQFTSEDALAEVVGALRGRSDSGPAPQNAGLYVVGFTALTTVKSASSLLDLITAVGAHGVEITAAFFGAVNDDRQLAYGFLLRLWSRYIGEEDPDWGQAAESLVRAAEALAAASLTTVADEALAGAIRVMSECGSAEAALRHADELLAGFHGPPLTSLRRAKARALMLNLRYVEAAEAWRDLLPTVLWDGTDFDLFSDYRDAAISYARADSWLNAAEMLQAGAARIDQASLGKWKAAMEFDAAAAFFRAKKCELAVAPLLRGCHILCLTEIDQNTDADYMIMKRIGHTVFWMTDPGRRSDEGFDAPPAAAASWLDTTRPHTDLPPTEVDMVLATASEYAYMYGTLNEAASFENRTLHSLHPIARVLALIVSVYRNAELGDGSRLISSLADLEEANEALERQTPPAPPPGRSSFAAELFTFGLIVPGLQNRIDAEFIGASRERARDAGIYDDLHEVFDQAEQIFVTKTIHPRAALLASTGTLQILSSVGFAATLSNRPESWVTVHTLWTEFALHMFRQPAGALLYRILSDRWSILVQHPIILSRPSVTVPRLSAALSSHDATWNKIADLLEAATDAAGSTLPSRVREALDSVTYGRA